MSSGWLSVAGSPALVEISLVARDQALRSQEPSGQLGLVAGRPHGDRHGDRFLVRPGRPDLQRRLADHPVVAHLERRRRGPPRSGGW